MFFKIKIELKIADELKSCELFFGPDGEALVQVISAGKIFLRPFPVIETKMLVVILH